jgi:hypothetical protein
MAGHRPITGPIVPLPPEGDDGPSPDVSPDPEGEQGQIASEVSAMFAPLMTALSADPDPDYPLNPAVMAGEHRPRSERWVYAERARYRRALNRVAVELARIERENPPPDAENITGRIRAIIREAQQ